MFRDKETTRASGLLVDGPALTCLSADPGPWPSFGCEHRPFEWGWRAVGLRSQPEAGKELMTQQDMYIQRERERDAHRDICTAIDSYLYLYTEREGASSPTPLRRAMR